MRPLLVALALVAAPLSAQSPPDSLLDSRHFSFHARGPYSPRVPRPDSLLGYELGSRNTQFTDQQRVLLAIAAAAPERVRAESLGVTSEGRTMRLFLVSSPENIARLDEIRGQLDRVADPRGIAAAESERIAAELPAIVWISESVHGNEAPGFESAMQLLYQLAASEEPATVAALRNTIVALNPSSNPDGHERFAVWYNSLFTGDPEPGAMEHDEPWSVQGRYNHYRFDMNRDVIASTQREVRALIRGMLRWKPMVAVDQHGQTENYFFPPAARPVNVHLGADAAKWLDIIGRGNAEAFDRFGWMYYVRDVFDLYYPGYWDTWPSLTGATGMTYETDGGGWKGVLWRREDGSLLSFRDGIAKHWVAAMATIETTGARRAERVRDYARFRRAAVEEGRTGSMRRVVLLPGSDPGRAAELASALARAGIEVRRASGGFSSSRAHAYYDDAAGARRFEAGAYVVDLAQPLGRLARAVLEPAPALDPTFARAQIEKYRRNIRRGERGVQEGYEFYDITAWSLPVAFGVDAYWTEDAPPVPGELLALPSDEPSPFAAPFTAPAEPLAVRVEGGIAGDARARSAYLFANDRAGASRLAWHLMARGFRVSTSTQPVQAGGERWPRGTFIVRVARNDTTLHAALDSLARASGVEVTGVNSAFTESEQYGIGSESTVGMVAPRLAVVGDEGISQTSYGAIWWTLERRYGMRFTPIGLGYLTGGDLSKFNVIILPDGSPGALRGRLGEDGASRLRSWVSDGGTLITMGGATAWAARDSGLTSAKAVGGDSVDTTGIAPSPSSDSAGRAQRRREQLPDVAQEDLLAVTSPGASNASPVPVPGGHFDVELDRTHWLTFGYERPRLTVLFDGSTFLSLSKQGTNVAVFPRTGRLLRAGFMWPDNTERLLRGTALVVEEPVGDGHVILFNNDPLFRGWWRAMDRLVMNGVLLGPTF
jgi:hypothetical protein